LLTAALAGTSVAIFLSSWEEGLVNQCSILYIKPGPGEETHAAPLRALGFSVDVIGDVPAADVFTKYHAVVVRVLAGSSLPVLGARLRAKPHFGRRVLAALVPAGFTERQRREAIDCGFDVALADACSARDLAAHILRRLRPFPEYRCLLRIPQGRRKAA
jgi:hypothetical protein